MNIFITSDTHFNHQNLIDHCRRPMNTAQEMDDLMIERWNSLVKKNDLTYHLGDFCWGSNKAEKYVKALNGRIVLIMGNHDQGIKKNLFYETHLIYYLRHNNKRFCLCHYPMLNWIGERTGAIHLHGHTHKASDRKNVVNVGVDSWAYAPATIEEILKIC